MIWWILFINTYVYFINLYGWCIFMMIAWCVWAAVIIKLSKTNFYPHLGVSSFNKIWPFNVTVYKVKPYAPQRFFWIQFILWCQLTCNSSTQQNYMWRQRACVIMFVALIISVDTWALTYYECCHPIVLSTGSYQLPKRDFDSFLF